MNSIEYPIVASGAWWTVKALATDPTYAEVLVYGDIGESWDGSTTDAKSFVEALGALDAQNITVRINSYGGSVTDGLAIYNAMKRKANCAVEIDGVAYSCASLIAMAGKTVRMAENSMMMIHAPWSVAMGNATDMRKCADMLDTYAAAMATSYMAKSGKSKADCMALLTDGEDHYFTAADAVAEGFADEITNAMPVAAALASKFDLSRFANPAGRTINIHQETDMSDVKDTAGSVETPMPNVEQIRAQALAGEKDRRADIRAAYKPFIAQPAIQALLDECLDNADISPVQAREKLLAKLGEGAEPVNHPGHSPRVEAGPTAAEKFFVGARNALEARAGLLADRSQLSNEFRGHTLLELARAALEHGGVRTGHMGKIELAHAALPAGAQIGIVQGSTLTHTSSDFANLLASIANKAMLKGYSEAAETFQSWTSTGSLPDFKAGKRVDLNEFPALAKIDEGGEYTIATVGDRGETVQLATYGKKFSITRQALINDDLNAFTRIPLKMGRAAIRTVGNLVYAVLTGNPTMSDGTALFHANHSNLLSGGTITTANVAAARQAMMKQKDASSNVTALNIPLRYVICPVALADVAYQVANSEYEVGSASGTAGTTGKNLTVVNYVRGAFEIITDARLDATSTSYWYTSADPAMFDTIEVSYLDGNSQPYLEQQNGWDVDGVEFKVRIDAGVKALDWRTLTSNH